MLYRDAWTVAEQDLCEGQGGLVRGEILEDHVCGVCNKEPVHQRMREIEVGTLKIDGQVAEFVPSDVDLRTL